MAYEYIKAGQQDWLQKLNETLTSVDIYHKHFNGTLLNGATGWGNADIWYNQSFFVASYNGWIVVPGSGPFIDFMDNPLSSIVDFKQVTSFNRYIPMQAQKNVAVGKAARTFINVGVDNGGALSGWYSDGQMFDTTANYGFTLHLPFFGSRSSMKI